MVFGRKFSSENKHEIKTGADLQTCMFVFLFSCGMQASVEAFIIANGASKEI